MRKEITTYAVGFLMMFLLGAFAPIGLGGGGAGFNGGSIASVVLGDAGTIAAPTYSFSGDTDVGVYRYGANALGVAVGGSEGAYASSDGGTGQQLGLANNSDGVGTAAAPTLISTDSDSGIRWPITARLSFIDDGTEFAFTGYDATPRARLCLATSANTSAPCLTHSSSAPSLGFTDTDGADFAGTLDIGSGSFRIDNGTSTYPNMTFSGHTTTGPWASGTADNIYFTTWGASTLNMYIGANSADGLSQYGTSSYIRIAQGAGAPTAGHCDADAERGRMYLDYTNDYLYMCDGVTNGWYKLALVDT